MNSIFLRKQIDLLLILILALLLLCYRINKPFVGHHDWNGVFFGNIAHNTQKFGFWQTKFGAAYTFLPQTPQELQFYTHYPPLFHLLQGLLAQIVGVQEWSMRLLSIIFSLAGLAIFFKLVEYLTRRSTAIIASLFFIFNPMFLYFGKMPAHEMFGLTFVVLAIYRYAVYFKTRRKRDYAWLIISLLLGCLTVWSAYYLAPLFIIHYYFLKKKINPKMIWLMIIPGLTFSLHLIHTYVLTGSWANNLFQTMLFRMQIGQEAAKYTFTWGQYLKQELLWLTVYFSRPICLLSFLALIIFMIQKRHQAVSWQEGIMVAIGIFPVIDLLLFRNVCYIHDYKLYYFLLSTPFWGAVGFNHLCQIVVPKKWSSLLMLGLLGLILFLTIKERLPYYLTLMSGAVNQQAYDLGAIIQKNTKKDQQVLVGSPSFGEFSDLFINYYSQRKTQYFQPTLADLKQSLDEKTKLVVLIKNREKPDKELSDYLEKFTALKTGDYYLYEIKTN
jgi:4-amino-4-deoxy-L-arabinose transferase-like glycosyltransferase